MYERNLLVKVEARYYFNSLTSIVKKLPAELKEALRESLPLYECFDSPPHPRGEFNVTQKEVSTEHVFTSRDGLWSAQYSSTYMCFTTTAYKSWTEFRTKFQEAFDPFERIYDVLHITRVGILYRDILSPSALGLAGTPWNELLHPAVLGPAALFVENANLQHSYVRAKFTLNDVTLQLDCGILGSLENNDSYVMDFDFSIDSMTGLERREADAALARCHSFSGSTFQWCLTDKLHDALGPQK